ncbi:MAG: cellulase family glycosylhydrolase [Symploca sp. SIO2E9]|nr:cellulase family glycosylhydrolase [Symploca sp. SIO2E9]
MFETQSPQISLSPEIESPEINLENNGEFLRTNNAALSLSSLPEVGEFQSQSGGLNMSIESLPLEDKGSNMTRMNQPEDLVIGVKNNDSLVGNLSNEQSREDTLLDISSATPERSSSSSSSDSKALLVADSENLGLNDRAIKNRLENLGYQVTVQEDDTSKSSDAENQDLVVISESVISSKVNTKFTNASVPIVNLEPYLYDDFNLTGSQADKDFGFEFVRPEVAITDDNLLGTDLSNSTKVYNSPDHVAWGIPNTNAVEIASLKDSQQKSVIFAYEEGAELIGGQQAPARRVGFFLSNLDNEGTQLTSSGWELFEGAVNWATGESSNNPNGDSPSVDTDIPPADEGNSGSEQPDADIPPADEGNSGSEQPDADTPPADGNDSDDEQPDTDTPPADGNDSDDEQPDTDTPPADGNDSDDEQPDTDTPPADGNDSDDEQPDTDTPPADGNDSDDQQPDADTPTPPADGGDSDDEQPSGKANGQFQVIGSKIYDPNGKEFIAKGTNASGFQYVWPGSTKSFADQIVDDWGFNLVRLNNYLFKPHPKGSRQYDDNNDINGLIKEFTDRGVVVMLEAHDRTGGYWEGSSLNSLKSWYKDLFERHKDNPYVWFNINEPGGSNSTSSTDKWVNQYQEIIKVRDEVGANNIVVADAHFWGQDAGDWNSSPVKESNSSILSHGDELLKFDGKERENVVFSVHLYDQWRFGDARMADYFDRVQDKDYALIVGEYGVENADRDTSAATRAMFNTAVPREIGRVVWSWWGGDDNDLTTSNNGGGQHINNPDNPTNLSWLGQQVWKDNRRREDLETL